MVEEIFEDLRESMEKALKAFHKDLGKVRTGRASLGILEGIRVDYYGSPTPLNQVATLSIPESRLIVIQPWEKKMTAEIERAIATSDLGLTPTNDGKVVRIAFPALTEERRKELVKVIGKMAEEARIVVRKARRDAIEMLKDLEKEGELAEDDSRKAQERVQKVHDEYIEKIGEALGRKEKEILEV